MASRLFSGGEEMNTMTDDKHVDRYVRITNRERFLIVRGLSLLAETCDTLGVAYEYGRTTPRMKELIRLGQVFCEENWREEYPIRYSNKVMSVQRMEKREE